MKGEMGARPTQRAQVVGLRAVPLSAVMPWIAIGPLCLVAYCLCFPIDRALGPSTEFIVGVDQETFLTGILYFIHDELRWPITLAQKLAAPAGTPIVYTDSAPIYALLLRPFASLLAPQANLAAVWLLFAYLLQGFGAAIAMRLAGVRSGWWLVAAAVMALSVPAFIIRWFNPALMAQGSILLALGLYLGIARQRAFRRLWPWFLLLLTVTLLVNPYLFVMASALFGASLLTAATQKQVTWSRATAICALFAGISLLELWVGGFFAGLAPGYGYGRFSMNLLSPFWPQRSTLLAGLNRELDATGGQWEGINYLGLGILLLLLLTVARPAHWRQSLKRHWPLLTVLVALTAYALSNRVFAGNALLLDFGRPGELFQHFRASGRFFWPVGFALLLGGLLALHDRWSRRRAFLLLALVVALQVVDTTEMRRGYRIRHQVLSETTQREAERWQPLIAAHDRLEILPPHSCTTFRESRFGVTHLVFHAAFSQTATNTVYVARAAPADCEGAMNALVDRRLQSGELLVAFDDPAWPTATLAVGPTGVIGADRHCRRFDRGVVCTRAWKSQDVADVADAFQSLDPQAGEAGSRLAPGDALSFGESEAPSSVALIGWRPPHGRTIWGTGPRSSIAFQVTPPAEGQPILLQLEGNAVGPPEGQQQRLTIAANGTPVWAATLASPLEPLPAEVVVPAALLGPEGRLRLSFAVAPSFPACAVLGNGDAESLNVGLRAIHRLQ